MTDPSGNIVIDIHMKTHLQGHMELNVESRLGAQSLRTQAG